MNLLCNLRIYRVHPRFCPTPRSMLVSITGFLVFLWAALSSAFAQEKNDFVQPEIEVKIENGFSKSQIW